MVKNGWLWSTLVDFGRLWSTLVDFGRLWSNLLKIPIKMTQNCPNMVKKAKKCHLNDYKLVLNDYEFVLNDQILPNLRSNLVESDHKIRIRPNWTLEFKIWNSKNRNSNEFKQIRPSLFSIFQFPVKLFSSLFSW